MVGDLILDRYIEGAAGRVSPEAPVLVFDWASERFLLGGAGNVAANLVSLGAHAAVLGVVGTDHAGSRLTRLLEGEGIEVVPLVVDGGRPTTHKSRFVSRTAQVLRVDQEDRSPLSPKVEDEVVAVLAERPFPYQAVLLSDYGKGLGVPRPDSRRNYTTRACCQMNTSRRGRRIALLAAVVVVPFLVVILWVSRTQILFFMDFERLENNREGYREYQHREAGIVFVRVPGGTLSRDHWSGSLLHR